MECHKKGGMRHPKVTVYHEKEQRQKANQNSKMTFLNVKLLGLSGKPHPIIANIADSREVPKLRIHLKFLTGDILTYERLAKDQDVAPHCRLCLAPVESTEHLLTLCHATAEVGDVSMLTWSIIFRILTLAVKFLTMVCLLQFLPSSSLTLPL